MAKGQASKELFYNKLLEVFPGSFMYNGNKEVRIPFEEGGEVVQLKIAATCAKIPVPDPEHESETVVFNVNSPVADAPQASAEITDEEKQNVADLLASLGLS